MEETGAALSQPPKSSSAVTVGAGLAAAPHPEPTSFAVSVAGTFIIEAADGAAGAAGSGSGALHALPPPHGSMLDESMLALTAGVETAGVSGWALGRGGGGEGLRLNADFISSWGDLAAAGGGGAAAAVVEGRGDDRPKRSSVAVGAGGEGLLGLLGCGGFDCCCGRFDANPGKPKSCPKEENESLRD